LPVVFNYKCLLTSTQLVYGLGRTVNFIILHCVIADEIELVAEIATDGNAVVKNATIGLEDWHLIEGHG
jgi:hypothetical protein